MNYIRTHETRGFTLIELLVVIAIIGILSSVVLASLNNARQKGRDARRISDLKQLQLALELYYDAVGQEYPDSICTTVASGVCTASVLMPTYISQVPNDPQATGTTYSYSYANLTTGDATCAIASGNCSTYVLGANVEGTPPSGSVTGTIGPTGDQVVCTSGDIYCVRP